MLYSTIWTIEVKYSCSKKLQLNNVEQLSGKGVFKIESGCNLLSPDFILPSNAQYDTIHLNKSPVVDLTIYSQVRIQNFTNILEHIPLKPVPKIPLNFNNITFQNVIIFLFILLCGFLGFIVFVRRVVSSSNIIDV